MSAAALALSVYRFLFTWKEDWATADDKASFMQRRVIARAAVRRVLRTVEVMRVGTFAWVL
jgi:hypothetical protein